MPEPMTSVEYFALRDRNRLPKTGQWLEDEGGFTDAGSIRFRNTGAYQGDTEGVITYDGTDLTFNDGTTTHVLENNAVIVEKAGTVIGTRPRINFIEGANVTLTIVDDGTDNEVDVTIAATSGTGFATIVTGSYTGDGSTSQTITGLGITPKLVVIQRRETVDGTSHVFAWTTDTIIDDNANGYAVDIATQVVGVANEIIAIASGSFTVDDAGSDLFPNTNGQIYNYYVIG